MCTPNVYPWFISIGEKYIKKWGMPRTLGDYYADLKDREIAEIVGLVIPENNREMYITELHNILGDNLWEMVKNRSFIHLTSIKKTLGNIFINGSLLFNILDWAWETCVEKRATIEYAVLGELGYINKKYASPLGDVIIHSNLHERLQMMLIKMTIEGRWDFLERNQLPCPCTPENKSVMRVFYPIGKGIPDEDFSEIIKFVGFKDDVDALFSIMAYRILMDKQPQEIELFRKRVSRWYYRCYMKSKLRVMVPTDCLE